MSEEPQECRYCGVRIVLLPSEDVGARWMHVPEGGQPHLHCDETVATP